TISFATSAGRDSIGTWLVGSSMVFAFIVLANFRSRSGGIIRLVRHGFNREPPLFEHEPRRLQPQILDRLGRRQAGFGPEYAAELPRAQAGGLGEPVHGKLRAQITSGKLKRSLYPI